MLVVRPGRRGPIGDAVVLACMRELGMRSGISITLSRRDWHQLEAITSDRNTAHKHVWRAGIVPMSADGVGTHAIIAATGTSKTTLWRWKERFAEAGVDGLLRAHPPTRRAPVPGEWTAVVRLTLEPPPHEATHWTARAMAREDRRACGLDSAEDLEGARPSPAPLARLR